MYLIYYQTNESRELFHMIGAQASGCYYDILEVEKISHRWTPTASFFLHFFLFCRGITRIHRLPSRPSHPYGRQPHSLIFMSTLYKASSRLPAKQLTNDHEPACMCHLYHLRINTHVLTFTMPCFIARHGGSLD